MEYPRAASLVVLALIQLCRAEHILPQWYSANIKEGFQPKPISEIFSSVPVFTPSKPIPVTQKIDNNISDKIDFLSTLPPSTMQSESTRLNQQTYVPTTTAIPAGTLYQIHLTQFNHNQLLDLLPKQQTYLQPNVPSVIAPVQLIPQFPKEEPHLQPVSEAPPQTTRKLEVQPLTEQGQTFTPSVRLTSVFLPQTTQMIPTSNSSPQPILVPNPPQFSPSPPSFKPPNSNYFLIYQQAPQSYPPSPGISEVTIPESTPTTASYAPPRTSEALSTYKLYPTSLISTTQLPTTWLSTTAKSTGGRSTLSSSIVSVTPSSTYGCVTTPRPVLQKGLKKVPGISFPLKIRVIAPTGSITNVNINPLTTTKRPVTRSTTRRPTTRRTIKPKRNNHARCLDGCRNVKDSICAAPLSHRAIDPKTLRGFQSVCHMACHNSYRKDPFEKVIEGSCSKLRTRIRLIDSKNKLKKDELRKNEYSIDQGQKTIIEFSGIP